MLLALVYKNSERMPETPAFLIGLSPKQLSGPDTVLHSGIKFVGVKLRPVFRGGIRKKASMIVFSRTP